MHHKEIEIKEEDIEEEFKDSRTKKILIGIIGIGLIGLMLSYTIFSGGNDAIILGLIGSSPVDNNLVQLNGLTIEFDANEYEKLIEYYLVNEGNEIKACMLGEKVNNYTKINSIVFPEVIRQGYDHILTKSCPEGTLISLHSHPNRRCMPSEQDVKNYKYLKQFNKDLMVAVMCEPLRLYFYS